MIIAHENYESFALLPDLLRKFPQFIPYYISALIKKKSFISDETNCQIKEKCSIWLNEPDLPEYISVALIKLFATDGFCDKSILLNKYRSLRRVTGDYIGRALLEAMFDKLDRNDILEIRLYFDRADLWEKRAILKLVKDGLPSREAQAFFKNVKYSHYNDVFIHWIIDKKK